ncbi:hypothetical protein UFOVP29_140 [uncultured Caudovirales phage]|uniref:Uncharacterized protein n=1 Tax=uncultured Caudovirales phage TaxID=2100421 RepID=A0A6J5KMH0_9CAUD|nr:hypothetical protein UFOVP29_140 [uncultured Caudovirales phage]
MDFLRYNSLPRMANWIIEYSRDRYYQEGCDLPYTTPQLVDIEQVNPYDTIFVKVDLLESSGLWSTTNN